MDAEHPLVSMVRRDAAQAANRALSARLDARQRGVRLKTPDTDYAQSDVERYACDVSNWLSRLMRVKVTIMLTARLIEERATGEVDHQAAFEVVRHHLIVHRAQMPTAKDTALRLIAAVWDLGVTPKVLVNEQIILSNRHMTEQLNAALSCLRKVVEPLLRERHEVLHEGGVVDPSELFFDHLEDPGDPGTKQSQAELLQHVLTRGFKKAASQIRVDGMHLWMAEKQLFDALIPIYKRHVAMLKAVEKPQRPNSRTRR